MPARKGQIPWNKGKKLSLTYRNKISKGLIGNTTGKASTEEKEIERKLKISTTMKLNPKSGGYRQGSGRGKQGWYKNYWCDSSWELAYVIYNLEHNIKFERNKKSFKYTFENKTYKYYPDFILEDGSFVEIKGRRTFNDIDERNKAKINQFKNKLKVLLADDLKPILQYVINKYGNKFVKLYMEE